MKFFTKQELENDYNTFQLGQVLRCIVPYEEKKTTTISNTYEKSRPIVLYGWINDNYFLGFYITTKNKSGDESGETKNSVGRKTAVLENDLFNDFYNEKFRNIDKLNEIARHHYFFSNPRNNNIINSVEYNRIIVLSKKDIIQYYYTSYELNLFYSTMRYILKKIKGIDINYKKVETIDNSIQFWSILPRKAYRKIVEIGLSGFSNGTTKLDNSYKQNINFIDKLSELKDRDILEFSTPCSSIVGNADNYYSLYYYNRGVEGIEHNNNNDKKYLLGNNFSSITDFFNVEKSLVNHQEPINPNEIEEVKKTHIKQNNTSDNDNISIKENKDNNENKNEKELKIEIESVSHYNKNRYLQEKENKLDNILHITVVDDCCRDKRLMEALSYIPKALNAGFTFRNIINNFDVIFERIDNKYC